MTRISFSYQCEEVLKYTVFPMYFYSSFRCYKTEQILVATGKIIFGSARYPSEVSRTEVYGKQKLSSLKTKERSWTKTLSKLL